MKFDITLGSFAIFALMSACNAQHADDSGAGPGDTGTGGDEATGSSTSDGRAGTGGSASDGRAGSGATSDGRAGSDGSVSDGPAGTGGSASDGRAGSGATSDGRAGSGATSDGRGQGGGSPNDGHAGAGGSANVGDDDAAGSPNDGDGDPAGAPGDGDDGGEPASGGRSASGGSGGLSGRGGSAGAPATGGFGGIAVTEGSGGVPSNGGSAGTANDAGSGGLPNDTGSGGSAGSGAAGGAASGGSGGDSSLDPEHLFTAETFGGNGRTCTTCHTTETGTISPDQVQALYSSNPGDPLFRPLDGDDGASSDYTALRSHATFRVSINLPPGVSLTSDTSATSVVFRRGVPTTFNSPSLDPVIMWDGREPSLTSQALDAILGHAQATVTPTADQLQLIAGFEQGPNFFSSDILREYAQGGPEPTWPAGVTDSEQRGRRWFAQDSAAPRFNICGQCHGGPMANTTQSNSGLPVGKRFQTVNVSEFNEIGNPTYTFTFPDPNNPGKTVTVTTPDPGRALVTGDVRDVNFFKIPTLWGVKNTAPYFHDNSANTLEELVDHYEKHLATFLPKNVSYPRPHVPTDQDKADIVAYLRLL